MDATDEDLIQAYADGDMEAFTLLYQRHRGKVLGYLVSRLKDRDEAEEVFQLVFVKLHRFRRKFRSGIPFLPWLFTLTRNVLLDYLRKNQVYRQHVTTSEEMVAAAVDRRGHEPLTNELATHLAGLSAGQRQAIELRYGQDLSFGEIAERLQTSAGNARQIVSRAVRTLRKFMTGQGVENESR